jgi:hypothetical protein
MNKSTTTKSPFGGASSNDSSSGGIVDQAKQTAANVASQAKEGVSQQIEQKFDSGRDKAIDKIETVSEALRGAGEKLEGTGPLPDLADKAAEGIDRLAHYFENKSVTDIVRSVESFARREPALFLGGALAMGVIAGRFLKSSGHRAPSASGGSAPFAGSSGFGDTYEAYGYEGEYGGDDFLTSDELQDDWDSMEEPIAFEAEDRGFGASEEGGFGSTTQKDLRTTQPQGSSFGGAGVGSPSRGDTEKMPVTQGSPIGTDTTNRSGR